MRLFCRSKDPAKEIWDGPRTGLDGAVEIFNADDAVDIDHLAEHLSSVIKSAQGPIYVDLQDDTAAAATDVRKKSRSIIDYLTANKGSSSSALDYLRLGSKNKKTDAEAIIAALSDKGSNTKPLKPEVEKLRLYKSEAEVAVMRKAAEMSADAQASVRRLPKSDRMI